MTEAFPVFWSTVYLEAVLINACRAFNRSMLWTICSNNAKKLIALAARPNISAIIDDTSLPELGCDNKCELGLFWDSKS